MVEHANVSSSNIHECKGASAASNHTVRIADGAGSGTWSLVPPASITGVNNVNRVGLNVSITDISTPSSHWVVSPIAGDIVKIYSVIDNAITGGNCGLSFEIAGTPVTNGGITITQAASAAGDIDSATPTAANTVTAGQAIEVISDGNSSTACRAVITLWLDVE